MPSENKIGFVDKEPNIGLEAVFDASFGSVAVVGGLKSGAAAVESFKIFVVVANEIGAELVEDEAPKLIPNDAIGLKVSAFGRVVVVTAGFCLAPGLGL